MFVEEPADFLLLVVLPATSFIVTGAAVFLLSEHKWYRTVLVFQAIPVIIAVIFLALGFMAPGWDRVWYWGLVMVIIGPAVLGAFAGAFMCKKFRNAKARNVP